MNDKDTRKSTSDPASAPAATGDPWLRKPPPGTADPRADRGRPASGMGLAMRMGTEMVVATLIGLGMGYGLDRWFGTEPWLLLLFFIFGAIAGFRNVYRLTRSE